MNIKTNSETILVLYLCFKTVNRDPYELIMPKMTPLHKKLQIITMYACGRNRKMLFKIKIVTSFCEQFWPKLFAVFDDFPKFAKK